jgi:adenine-specific DNA-methyltransferase
MPKLPANSFDLIITSPPYNANKEYEKKLSFIDYEVFAERWVSEIPRLIKPTGSFWLNVGYMKTGKNQTLPLTYLYYPLINLDFIQEIVWHYEGGMSYKLRFTHRTERWMWFCSSSAAGRPYFDLDAVRDPALNRTKDKRNNPLGKNPTDYWYFDRVVGGTGKTKEKTQHPCQFPEKMIERIIKACCPENGNVLDPFAGSCTVGKVCDRLNRNAICIEQNHAYIPKKFHQDR